jgi:hypothetical protein
MCKKQFTDTELLDYLEALHGKLGVGMTCVVRPSSTGPGWRLHSSFVNSPLDLGRGFTVREALTLAAEKGLPS